MTKFRHNDFPNSLRNYEKNQVGNLDISNLTARDPWATSSSSHTDINRLRQGKVGAQVKKKHHIDLLCLRLSINNLFA